MGKISKLFKGELKKIFLGVGIFFMTALLLVAITISPKLFSPNDKTDITTSTNLSANTVKDIYNSFLTYKAEFSSRLDNLKDNINDLIDENDDFKAQLTIIASDLYSARVQLNNLTFSGGTISQKMDCLNLMIEKTEEYQSLYASFLNNYALPLILVDKDLDYDINFEIETLLKILNKERYQEGTLEYDKNTEKFYQLLNQSLENYGCAYNIKEHTNSIKNLVYSAENLSDFLQNYYSKKDEYKLDLLSKIEENNTNAITDDAFNNSIAKVKETRDYAYSYLAVEDNCYVILQDRLLLEVYSNCGETISSYLRFEDFNSYKVQEELSKKTYLFNNNKTDADFANVFAFNTNTSSSKNTFDYMFFSLEIASFLIIAFTVIVGAGMISKEYNDGTIKLLAIRPFKRNKILFAKILATMFLSFIFVLATILVTLISGYFLYGISFPTVLLVFNATHVFTLPIWVVFLIYVACLMIKIWVFSLLAIAISTIFKSYVFAVVISSGIYIINLIVTFVAKGASWLKYNIFANLDLFKFFGGSFNIDYVADKHLDNLFVSHVLSNTSIIIPAIIIGALVVVLNVLMFTIFKHRDIA